MEKSSQVVEVSKLHKLMKMMVGETVIQAVEEAGTITRVVAIQMVANEEEVVAAGGAEEAVTMGAVEEDAEVVSDNFL